MLRTLRHGLRGMGLALADRLVTLPVLRWTWRGLADDSFAGAVPDLRPADHQSVRDMMGGRFLFAARMVESGGASPFSLEVDDADWRAELHSFGWLRHFRDIRDPGERGFARMLVLDWIGREGRFRHQSWALPLAAPRVLNWLRHLPLLLDGATPLEARRIGRVLGAQIQSLKVRAPLARDPVDRLFAAIALLAAEYCEQGGKPDVEARLIDLNRVLAAQIDPDGLHRSRNGRLQLQLLSDLVSVRRIGAAQKSEAGLELGAQIDRMHEALDALTLSTGEPAYFNGCGHLPHDVLVAIQAGAPARAQRSRLVGGYGILRSGASVVVADSGLVPPPAFASEIHAGALAFEFSHGSDLLVGSCGPAPANLPENQALFRQAIAHSSPTLDGEDPLIRTVPDLFLRAEDHLLTLAGEGYRKRFGISIERRLTLLSGGTTLVGQDRITPAGTPRGLLNLRFHLAPGIDVRTGAGAGMVRLVLPRGAVWSFLWEGASMREDESVRQSPHLGFNRTRQLVLEADVATSREVAWIFTLEQR